MGNSFSLSQLGWKPFFQQQLTLDELDSCIPARVFEQHRSEYVVATETAMQRISITPNMPKMAVGDWLLLDENNGEPRFCKHLDPATLFSRKAVGTRAELQLIAANVDTVFIVCSLNNNFNLSRIERYLAMANDANVDPVVVLSKADTCNDVPHYVQQVQLLDPMLLVEAVNALDTQDVAKLEPWCKQGQTVAFMGSSGVGKSTLINTLLGEQSSETAAIREADSKGRHTTTARAMHLMTKGGLLLDTPGMRELQLSDCEEGVNATFNDITELAQQCKFGDCQHNSEPGCQVRLAINKGELEERRLINYQKLMREQQFNAASIAERRFADKELGKFYRRVQNSSKQFKQGG
ncbi:putative ribosome biogenesis GTPase RsgA 2 [Agarivorans sp. Toyoura001]|uniref:ribosome small subunit-dependent GTPase A n=1 Tax=Agarivorans sp. Toyoura001 TaxID=2283141 RepID=UPI0010F3014B|nr:ribosome small subunit-dependent GTPase A [Agarivorans sp. Toyoura001]GDY24845.1 putative ribosome biogenesis GTPase RsgA 2 [Agarivorans sp. Toyoura001]